MLLQSCWLVSYLERDLASFEPFSDVVEFIIAISSEPAL